MANLVPVTVLGLLCATPLIFLPPPLDFRAWYYEALTQTDAFALGGYPSPGRRSLGLRVWDWTHVYSVVIALVTVPVGLPLALWFSLGLGQYVSQGLSAQVSVAQLLVAVLVGGIAVNVFLSSQLPRLASPRVVCTFLMGGPSGPEEFLERFVKEETFQSGEPRWVHLRLTNVGTLNYSGLTVSCDIPDGWDVPFTVYGETDETPPRLAVRPSHGLDRSYPHLPLYARPYRYIVGGKSHVDFFPADSPRDTGSGATAVYQIFLQAPRVDKTMSFQLRVKVSTNEVSGAAVCDLKLRLYPLPSPPSRD